MIRSEHINAAIERLKALTGEDFYGYRSEVWGVLADVYDAERSTDKAMILFVLRIFEDMVQFDFADLRNEHQRLIAVGYMARALQLYLAGEIKP